MDYEFRDQYCVFLNIHKTPCVLILNPKMLTSKRKDKKLYMRGRDVL